MAIAIIGIVSLYLAKKIFFWKAMPWPAQAMQLPKFQAHRGFHNIERENSLSAFRAALLKGAEMIELDVRLSRDRQAIVFHDKDLFRITGDKQKISNLNSQDLKSKYDIPTLFEVLQDSQIPFKINIELKAESILGSTLEFAVAKAVKKAKAESRVLFSSFNPATILKLSYIFPNIPRALLVTQKPEPNNYFYIRKMWAAPWIKFHLLHLDYRDVSLKKIKKYKQQKIPVALWTVNDKALCKNYLEAGAVSIILDQILSIKDLSI